MSKVVVLWASLFVACAPLEPHVSTVYHVYWPGPSVLYVLRCPSKCPLCIMCTGLARLSCMCSFLTSMCIVAMYVMYGKIPLSTSKSAKNTFCEHAICAITLSTSKSAKTTFNSCDHRLLNDMQLTMNSFFSQQDPRGGN